METVDQQLPGARKLGESEQMEHRGSGGSGNSLYDTVMADAPHFIVQSHRTYNTRANLNVNYGLWMIMTCQGSSVGANVSPGGDDNGEAVLEGAGRYMGNLCTFPLILLQTQNYFKKESLKK